MAHELFNAIEDNVAMDYETITCATETKGSRTQPTCTGKRGGSFNWRVKLTEGPAVYYIPLDVIP